MSHICSCLILFVQIYLKEINLIHFNVFLPFIQSMCGWYASYWNAHLFYCVFHVDRNKATSLQPGPKHLLPTAYEVSGKVMFSQVSVILFTWGGGGCGIEGVRYMRVCPEGGCLGRLPHPPQPPPPPPPPPHEMATAMDGAHPTVMQFFCFEIDVEFQVNSFSFCISFSRCKHVFN